MRVSGAFAPCSGRSVLDRLTLVTPQRLQTPLPHGMCSTSAAKQAGQGVLLGVPILHPQPADREWRALAN